MLSRETEDANGALPDIKADDIQFVSAVCAGLATKPIPEWRDEERHYFDSLAKSYPDWLDSPDSGEISDETKAWLSAIGNAEAIQEKLRAIQEEKFSIMAENVDEFLTQKRAIVACELGKLADGLKQQREEVRNGVLKDMAKQKEAIGSAINAISENVSWCWTNLLSTRVKGFKELGQEVRLKAHEARAVIHEAIGTRQKQILQKRDGWIARQFHGSCETVTYEEQYLKENEIKSGIANMVEDIELKVQRRRDDIFDRALDNDASMKFNIIVANDLSNEIAAVIRPEVIQRSVRQAIELVTRDGRSALKNESFNIRDYEVDVQPGLDNLDYRQEQALDFVAAFVDRIDEGIKCVDEKVDKVAEKAKEQLLPAATEQLQAYHKQLEKDIRSREFSLKRYEQVINAINKHRQELLGLEL